MTALVRGVAHHTTPAGPDTDRDQCPTNRRDGYAPTCGHPEADHHDHLCPEEGDVSDLNVGDYVKAGFTTYRVVNPVYRWQRIEVVDAVEINRRTNREGTAPRRLPIAALTKLAGPPMVDVHLPDTHVHTEVCEHRLVSHEVSGVSECYSCGPHIRDQYCPHACTTVAEETA